MPAFVNYYLEMWKRFTDFSGRTSVPAYWWAFLCNVVVSFVCGLIGLGSVYSIIALVPGLAMSIRRLNDTGKHWLWILASLIPAVGWIILVVMLCKPSAQQKVIDV